MKIPKTNLNQFKGGVRSGSSRIGKGLGPAYSKDVASMGHPLVGKVTVPNKRSFGDLISNTYGRSKII